MNAITRLLLMTTMMTAMKDTALDTVKTVSRSLRREGAYREAVNQKIAQLTVRIPARLMISPVLQDSAWIRDSLAQAGHKMIDWVAALRPKDRFGNWLAKGEFGHTYDLRDREQTTYEPRLTMAGIAATMGRRIDGWKGKSYLVESTLRMRSGKLRNGNNPAVWAKSESRKEAELLATYAAMKQTPSVIEATKKALAQGTQKWMPVVFFNVVDLAGEVVFSLFADAAYTDSLVEQGYKVRTVPFVAAGGEN